MSKMFAFIGNISYKSVFVWRASKIEFERVFLMKPLLLKEIRNI